MIKLKGDDKTFVFEYKKGMHLIVENEYTKEIVEFLQSYFSLKKKTKGVVYDENDDVIKTNDFEFVYYPFNSNIEDNFEFKSKTIFSTEISSIIASNPEKFTSVEIIRKNLEGLFTDSGFYELKKILQQGVDNKLIIDTTNFEIQKILNNICIDGSYMQDEEKYKIVYNLLIYLNRNNKSIVYIDFPISDKSIKWINYLSESNLNTMILVNNICCDNSLSSLFNSLLIINNSDNMISITKDKTESNLISYLLHPYIMNNRDYQTEKNIEIIDYFDNKNISFSVEFTIN